MDFGKGVWLPFFFSGNRSTTGASLREGASFFLK